MPRVTEPRSSCLKRCSGEVGEDGSPTGKCGGGTDKGEGASHDHNHDHGQAHWAIDGSMVVRFILKSKSKSGSRQTGEPGWGQLTSVVRIAWMV